MKTTQKNCGGHKRVKTGEIAVWVSCTNFIFSSLKFIKLDLKSNNGETQAGNLRIGQG
jgi:hypothetical protein